MKVLVLGAAGKTGSLMVERALAKGHEVTVLVRDASRLKKQGVRVLIGDATKPDDVLKAVRGQDAVIETIGGTTPYRTTKLESTSVRNIIGAMHAEGVRRLIVISTMGLGESRAQAPFWYKHLLMCRAYGARIILGIDSPALPGWADVWQSALRAGAKLTDRTSNSAQRGGGRFCGNFC